MSSILEGLRVVEGSAFVAAPLGGMTLAQLGAEVIRFDVIGGGIDHQRWPLAPSGASLYWAGMNKGKKSIAVDIRRPEGQELIVDLITCLDPGGGIFLTNLASARWLQHEHLQKQRQDVISLHILGNPDGSTAVDYTVNSAAGFPFVTGDGRPEAPVNNVVPAWDIATGLHAAVGILAAERHRRLAGEGQLIKIALSDVAFAVAGHLGYIAEAQINQSEREQTGNYLYGAFGRNFATQDGRQVMVIAISSRQWRGLCAATEIEAKVGKIEALLEVDLSKEGDRYRARETIAAVMEPWFKRHSFAEVSRRLDQHGVCWGPYQSFQQMVSEDPRVSEANPLFRTVHQPGIGDYLMPGSPLSFSAFERTEAIPAPLLGQHTEQILGDYLGLTTQAIGVLHDKGIVASPDR